MYSSPPKSSEPGTYELHVLLTGAGAAVPAKTRGNGLAVTRQAVGVYRLTVGEDLGPFMSIEGATFGVIGAGALADVKGYTVTYAWNAAGKYFDVAVWTSAFAAADLAATQVLGFTAIFKNSTAV